MANSSVAINITATDAASGVLQNLQRKFGEINAETERVSRRFTEINSGLASLAGAVSLAGVGAMAKSFIDAGLQLEKLNKLFSAAAGSANLGGREMDYVRQVSQKMGLDVLTTAESYGKFTAAIRNTTLEGEAGRKVFESVSGASTVLGLSADETKGIFNALQQMMSKGKVQAEELRGQLGERLPGAFKMAADAMGVTTAQLDKMMADGKVLAADLLPKLAEQLDKTYGQAAADGAKSAAAEINRMNNAMFDAKAATGTALIPVFTDIVKAIVPAMAKLQEFTGGLQILAVRAAALYDKISAKRFNPFGMVDPEKMRESQQAIANINKAEQEQIDEIIKRNTLTSGDYTAAEKLRQAGIKPQKGLDTTKKVKSVAAYEVENAETWGKGFASISADMDKFNAANQKAAEELAAADALRVKQSAALAHVELEVQNPYNRKLAELEDYYKARKAVIDAFEVKSSADEERRAAATMALDAQVAERRKELTEMSWTAVGGIVGGQLSQISAMMNKANHDQFMAYKALMIAQATIATSMAIVGILAAESKLGMLAIPLAFTAGAVGAAQVALIAAQKPPARAMGGPVFGGTSYLVGERGPELFTPGASGQISSNDKLGGLGGTVNVTPIFQISTGVTETARAELARAYPMIIQGAVSAVKQAMRNGEFQGAY